jgi:hypothetical protein
MAESVIRSAVSPPVSATQRRVRLMWWLLGLAGAGLGLGLLYTHPPETSWFYPPCLFHRGTGFYCPGCGATRALYSLLHGNWKQAAQQNLLLVALLPALATFLVMQGFAAWKQAEGPWSAIAKAIPWALLTVVVLFGLFRNLPFPWAAWMAP